MSEETLVTATPPDTSPASTTEPTSAEIPRCLKCKEHPGTSKDGLCFSCYFLPRIEPTDWVTCPGCMTECNKLKVSGVCWDCEEKKIKDRDEHFRTEARLKRIFGSTKAMNHYTFQRFRKTEGNEEAMEACQKFDANTDNVYLWGPCGTGKTHLAYATAKSYALNGRQVIITTPLRMVDAFRTKDSIEKEDRFEEYTETELLLIDDLGISKYTDFGLEILCEILNRRTLQMRNGLLVTSNLSMDQLAKRNNDDRLASRLSGLCRKIALVGMDFRVGR